MGEAGGPLFLGQQMSRIRVKRIYDVPDGGDGERILVDRVWPRGLSKGQAAIDCWLKDLAPSTELRKWFGHDPERWTEFKKRYRRELQKSRGAVEALKVISGKKRVTLLFAARDTDHNNAVALREYLDEWQEWEAGPDDDPEASSSAGVPRTGRRNA